MMPRRLLPSIALVALAVLVSSSLTGCTAIGFGVGAMVDSTVGKGSANRLVTVRPGTSVTIWLNDGRRLHGRFLGSRDSISESPVSAPPRGNNATSQSLRSVVLLGTDRGIRQIPIGEVRRVSVPVMRGKVLGLVTGLTVDVLFLLAIAAAAEQLN
jgi:hypothetical protein